MDSYPQFLLKDPRPLVFVVQSVDDEFEITGRLIATLEKCNTEIEQKDFPAVIFKSVTADHPYVPKKNPKEYQSVDGILKYSSLQKHFELLPSVVVLTASFTVEWQASDWAHLNESLLERMNGLREHLKGRDVRLYIVVVRTGTGQIAPDIIEEKMVNLRRHLTLENHRTFASITLSDLSSQPPNSAMKRICKSIRELSFVYYNVLEKRARFLLKTARIRGSYEGLLTVRYSFKLAYFLLFQGLKLQALKYYRQCVESIIGIVIQMDEELVDQLKAVAEFANFKVCNMFLESGSSREAISQFMIHTSTFSKVYTDLVWKHCSWMCNQHIVFLQLLDLHKVTNAALLSETVDRYFFIQNALRFALKRQYDFQRVAGLISDTDEDERKSRSHILTLVVSPAKYVGGKPFLIDPVLGAHSGLNLLEHSASSGATMSMSETSNSESKLTAQYLVELERAVDVSGFIFKLLQRCEEYLGSEDSSNRRRTNINVLLSEQLETAGKHDEALSTLMKISESYIEEDWMLPLIPILKRTLSCCIMLGRPFEYVATAITLCSLDYKHDIMTSSEREKLHCDILGLIKCDLPCGPVPSGLQTLTCDSASPDRGLLNHEHKMLSSKSLDSAALSRKKSFSDSNGYLCTRKNYGSAATLERASESCLPMKTTIVMNSKKGSMFEIHADYSAASVEIGNSVTVTLTIKSKMQAVIMMDEILLSFSGGKLMKRITHPIGSAEGEEAENVRSVSEKGPVRPQSKGFSPPAKARSQYCSSYLGALSGNRIVSTHTDSSGSEVSYACLSIPPLQAVTYSFPLDTYEAVLTTLPSADLSVCLESVKMTIRTPISSTHSSAIQIPPFLPSPEVPDTSDASTLQLLITPSDITSSTEQFREIILDISPLSTVFRKAVVDRSAKKDDKAAVKPVAGSKGFHTLSDLRLFYGALKSPKVLLLTRPLALLDLISPTVPPTATLLTIQTEKKIPGIPKKPVPQSSIPAEIPTATLLQGPVQRLDLIFQLGDTHMINGRIYLSSDFSPSSSNSALFWAPDVEPLLGTDPVARSSYMLDAIAYHPLLLNSSYQPTQPLHLPHLKPHSVYCVPLFLRSEIQGSYKLRLLTEFIPKGDYTSTVSKEVEVNVTFLKPLNMNFSLSSEREAQCGVVREGFMSTVLEGDTVNMSASLGCANALGGEIQILGITFLQAPPVAQADDYYDDNGNINDSDSHSENDSDNKSNGVTKKLLPPLFQLANDATSVNLLQLTDEPSAQSAVTSSLPGHTTAKQTTTAAGAAGAGAAPDSALAAPESAVSGDHELNDKLNGLSLSPTAAPDAPTLGNKLPKSITQPPSCAVSDVLLKKGEVYVSSTDIICTKSNTTPSLPFTAQVASMGDLYVDWKLHNDHILSPPDLTPWTSSLKGKDKGEGKGEGKGDVSVAVDDFKWLLQSGPQSAPTAAPTSATNAGPTGGPIGGPTESNPLAIDKKTSTTRVCGMVFSVPRVKISPAPFAVTVSLSSTCRKNEILPVEIVIRNNLRTAEHLSLYVNTSLGNVSGAGTGSGAGAGAGSSASTSTTIPGSSSNVSLSSNKSDNEGATGTAPSSSAGSSNSSGFLVVGNANSLLDISPMGLCTISLSLVPLQTGFLCLPHICVSWERNNAVVIELSSNNIPKFVFVHP